MILWDKMKKNFFKWIESEKVITCFSCSLLSMLFYGFIKNELLVGREYLSVGITAFLISFSIYKIAYESGKNCYNKIIEDCSKSIEINPTDAEAYYKRGNAWDLKSVYDKAIVDYSKAIEIDSNYTMAYSARGKIYAEHGEYDRMLGSRHRAAIGLSKETDAAVVVISEETGNIALAVDGKLARLLTLEQLRQQLLDLMLAEKKPTNKINAETVGQ